MSFRWFYLAKCCNSHLLAKIFNFIFLMWPSQTVDGINLFIIASVFLLLKHVILFEKIVIVIRKINKK